MKDLEAAGDNHVPPSTAENTTPGKRSVIRHPVTFCSLLILFVFGFIITHCGGSTRPLLSGTQLLHAQQTILGEAHHLERRDDCNDTIFDSSAAAVTAAATSESTSVLTFGSASATLSVPSSLTTMAQSSLASAGGLSVAISTHTAISVIYSFYTTPEPSSWTQTHTLLSSTGFEEGECTCVAATETVSVVVTVVPSTLGDATVTGNPTTVTDVNTDLSFTKGLPDVTVSGNPSTLTELQTDVSYTSGLPDATISGLPSTLTDVQTDISLTSGLPDATISGNPSTLTQVQTDMSLTSGYPDVTVTGNPSTVTNIDTSFLGTPHTTVTMTTVVVISDLWGPISSSFSTATGMATTHRTITTVYSSLWTVVITASGPEQSSTFQSSEDWVASSKAEGQGNTQTSSSIIMTEVVTKTESSSVLVTTTVLLPSAPYPSVNGTASTHASGTISHAVPPTTSAVVISEGSKKPGPRGLGGSGGTSNLGCTVMLIAVILCLL